MFRQRLGTPKSSTTPQRRVLPPPRIEGSPFAEFYPGLPRIAALSPTYYHHNHMFSNSLLHDHTILDDYNPLPPMDHLFPSSNYNRSLKQPSQRSSRRNHPYHHHSKRRHAQEHNKVSDINGLSLFGAIPEPCGQQVQEEQDLPLSTPRPAMVLDDDAVFEEMQLFTESLAPARQSVLSPPSSPLLSDLDDIQDFALFP